MNEEEFSELLKMLHFMESHDRKNFDVNRFMSANLTQEQSRQLEKEFGKVKKSAFEVPYNYFEMDYF